MGEEWTPLALEVVLKAPEGASSKSSRVGSLEVAGTSSLVGALADNAVNELFGFGALYSPFLDCMIPMNKGWFKDVF